MDSNNVADTEYLEALALFLTPCVADEIDDIVCPSNLTCDPIPFHSETPTIRTGTDMVIENIQHSTIEKPKATTNNYSRRSKCAVNQCEKSSQSFQLCFRHGGYRICSVQGCNQAVRSQGRCTTHGGGYRCEHVLSTGKQCGKRASKRKRCPRHTVKT